MSRTEDQHDDADRRLTPAQREMRDRNANLPKHLRRSIDQFRIARGMVPLWGACVDQRHRKGKPSA